MKKIFILMMMLALFDSCVCMRQSMTEAEKLARIERLHMDAALGQSGVDNELLRYQSHNRRWHNAGYRDSVQEHRRNTSESLSLSCEDDAACNKNNKSYKGSNVIGIWILGENVTKRQNAIRQNCDLLRKTL